jgi:Na+/H+-dicarboxylate symporter
VSKTEQSYAPLFSLTPIISNDFTLLAGVVFGIFCAQIKHKKITRLLKIAEAFVGYFFKILLPLMPLFIFGTALKLDHDGMISMIVSEYFIVALIFLLSCCGYILLQLFFVAGCSFKKEAEYLKNLLPAVIAGFGTMSSIAALPLSVSAAEKNSSDKNNARVIVPCTVNIHLVGDCFFIPFMALAILFRFGREIPDILTYLTFSLYFVAAKFAVAAVPAGGIIVMLPILQNYLGFDSEMLGLIMAIYVLFDPFVTGCNVAGNCSLAIIFDKVVNRLKRKVDGSNNELDPGKSHVNCVVRAD